MHFISLWISNYKTYPIETTICIYTVGTYISRFVLTVWIAIENMALFSEIGNNKYGNWIVFCLLNENFILLLIKIFSVCFDPGFLEMGAQNYRCVLHIDCVGYILTVDILNITCFHTIRNTSIYFITDFDLWINLRFVSKWDSIYIWRWWLSCHQWIIENSHS